MFGFEYNGKSTQNIISTPLLLVTFDTIGSLGMTRSKIEGDRTISRPITNEYGTIYDPLSFTYALIKQDFEEFTNNEQRIVERWLTSPKLSSELKVTDCFGEECSYFGLFISTEWQIGTGGYIGVQFTFEVNGTYPFKYFSGRVWSPYSKNEDTGVVTILDSGNFTVYNDTDELEEYVYPVIKIKSYNNSYTSSFTLRCITDENNRMSLTTQRKDMITLDCQHCMAYWQTSNILTFKDLGWEDVDNIYWARLLPGENQFYIEGTVNVDMSFYIPYKKVGGWAV